jgi:hypothetical protein
LTAPVSLAAGQYFWRARAFDSATTGPYSGGETFTTTASSDGGGGGGGGGGGSACTNQSTPYLTLLCFREDYPDHMTASQHAALLNRVAWKYRNDGMRLLGKASGNNCPMPNGTPISCDYLVHAPSLTGHDVLSGQDDGTHVVKFTWGPGPEPFEDAIESGSRTLVSPVQP